MHRCALYHAQLTIPVSVHITITATPVHVFTSLFNEICLFIIYMISQKLKHDKNKMCT